MAKTHCFHSVLLRGVGDTVLEAGLASWTVEMGAVRTTRTVLPGVERNPKGGGLEALSICNLKENHRL